MTTRIVVLFSTPVQDPTVWLDRARPTNTCILHWEHTCAAAQHTLPKNPFASAKKLAKFSEITFLLEKSEKKYDKLTFGNGELVECKI
jgi:hypothetical protein